MPRGYPLGDPRALRGIVQRDGDRDYLGRPGGGASGNRVRPDRDNRRALGYPRVYGDHPAEVGVLGHRSPVRAGGHVDCVGQHAGVRLDSQPPGDLLALGGPGDQHRSRRLVRDELREQFSLRRDHILAELCAVRDVDAGRAELRQPLTALLGTQSGPHDRRLAEAGRRCQQLARDLLDLTARVLGEHQYLCHDQTNAAAVTPPSPSSLTMTPAARGGRDAKSATSVAELASPTSAGSIPASARDKV